MLGDEIEDVISYIPEPENLTETEKETCDVNETDLRSDLISAEDRAQLGDNDTTDGDK